MRYTVAPDAVTHPGTGHSMHQQTGAITTEITAEDFNQVIWSLMAVQEAGGVGPVAFDEDVPASYQALRKAIINLAVPVGTVKILANGQDPNTLYPGTTWARYGAGRVVVGLDSSDSDFDAVGETGGEKTHTLTQAEVPNLSLQDGYFIESSAGLSGEGVTQSIPLNINGNAGAGTSDNDNNTMLYRNTTTTGGGGGDHNNLQPYIVAAMWVRNA